MATAVICECNPFHNGHEYLFRTAKLLTGGELIAVMSGSFTQRGEAAVTDKYTRAGAALRGGADVVAELPAVCAVANAQRFAEGGVRVAKSFACVDTLAFGIETEDLRVLETAANALRSERVNALVAEEMKRGGCYPHAVEAAVREPMYRSPLVRTTIMCISIKPSLPVSTAPTCSFPASWKLDGVN